MQITYCGVVCILVHRTNRVDIILLTAANNTVDQTSAWLSPRAFPLQRQPLSSPKTRFSPAARRSGTTISEAALRCHRASSNASIATIESTAGGLGQSTMWAQESGPTQGSYGPSSPTSLSPTSCRKTSSWPRRTSDETASAIAPRQSKSPTTCRPGAWIWPLQPT